MSNRKYIELAMTIDPEVGEKFMADLKELEIPAIDGTEAPGFFLDGHTLEMGVSVTDSDASYAVGLAIELFYGALDEAGVEVSELASPFSIVIKDTDLLIRNLFGQTGEYDEDVDDDEGDESGGDTGSDDTPDWDDDGSNELVAGKKQLAEAGVA